MDEWHYDPAADFDEAQKARLQDLSRTPGILVSGMRSVAAVGLRCWLRLYHRLTIVGRRWASTMRVFQRDDSWTPY